MVVLDRDKKKISEPSKPDFYHGAMGTRKKKRHDNSWAFLMGFIVGKARPRK
jgi:hypothetical protein